MFTHSSNYTLEKKPIHCTAKLLAEDSPVPPSHSTTLLPTVSQDEPPDTTKEDRMETSKKKRKNFKSKGDYTYSKYYIETEKLTVDNPFRWIGEDADLYQQVVLQMALAHDYDSKAELRAAATMDGSSTVISEGFFWRDYPVLERILFENMEDYYRASNNRHHTKHQQSFNTMLVDLITNEAQKHGLTFEYDMDEKKLRDRIRCFYKTRKCSSTVVLSRSLPFYSPCHFRPSKCKETPYHHAETSNQHQQYGNCSPFRTTGTRASARRGQWFQRSNYSNCPPSQETKVFGIKDYGCLPEEFPPF